MFCIPTVYLHHFQMSYNRFGTGCFRTNFSDVVKLIDLNVKTSMEEARVLLDTKFITEFVTRFPFDWQHPIGYIIAIAIQYVMLSYTLLIGAFVSILFIESFIYVIAMGKCVKTSLFAVGQRMDVKSGVLQQFIEFIEFDSHVKWSSSSI